MFLTESITEIVVEVVPETVEAVKAALAEMAVPVFLAPGNHDPYGPTYTGDWPGNVHIFRTSRMESVPLPELGVTVHGAAFLAPTQEEGLLRGFTAPEDGTAPSPETPEKPKRRFRLPQWVRQRVTAARAAFLLGPWLSYIMVEVLKDVVFNMCPAPQEEVMLSLKGLKNERLLKG